MPGKHPLPFLSIPVLSAMLLWAASIDGDLRASDVNMPEQAGFAGLVAHEGLPKSEEDWSFAPFSDQGAWFGFALPPPGRHDLRGGFTGPFLMSNGRWLSPQLLRLSLLDVDTGRPVLLSGAKNHALTSLPGMLNETMTVDGLSVRQSLWFDRLDAGHSGMALVRVTIKNTTARKRTIAAGWSGEVFDGHRMQAGGENRLLVSGASDYTLRLTFGPDPMGLELDGLTFGVKSEDPHTLEAGASMTASVAVDLALEGDPLTAAGDIVAGFADTGRSYRLNRDRWKRWLAAVDPGPGAGETARAIAVKSLQTLVNNWRGPAGRLDHHGMFPSHNVWYFNGYWAWDTWKQAVGVLIFDDELARALVRGMFRHQDRNGMIADVVYLDAKEDNWRDSKPPLAGWAVDAIYRQTGDLEFVRELYPKLVAYHRFWYRDRDHDRDGLCEYGSTDGTLEAARWESGMDNAVRFDATSMLQNGESAWSMNQESVDLNSYLYVEKLALARLADALGQDGQAWLDEANQLKSRIIETFYSEANGWFYDAAIDDGAFVLTQGPEGWIPLWAGIASQQQAGRLVDVMLDPEKFRTHVPFPTVAADNPEFSDGYWRGLVWLDQAWFAIDGLRRYGFEDDADDLTRQLFSNLEGVAEPGVPIRENYHPLTGEGQNVRHFSWSAAHQLMLSRDLR